MPISPQEVWLRALCAVYIAKNVWSAARMLDQRGSDDVTWSECAYEADAALDAFTKKFPAEPHEGISRPDSSEKYHSGYSPPNPLPNSFGSSIVPPSGE